MAFISVVGHGTGSQCNKQLLLVCWVDCETAPSGTGPICLCVFPPRLAHCAHVHHDALQDGEMIRRKYAPREFSCSHTGCIGCGGDVAEASPSCLSHLILGISLQWFVLSLVFKVASTKQKELPNLSSKRCSFYHLHPSLSVALGQVDALLTAPQIC